MNYRILKYFSVVCVLTVLLLQSCVPTQTAIREENKAVPETFQNEATDTVSTAAVKWNEFFTDPELVQLIDSALANNQELNMMLQRIAIANNEVKARTGEYLPFVDVYAGTEVEKVGEFTRDGAVEENLNIREDQAFPDPLTNFSAGLTASWELDVWKKLRNGKKAAVMEYLASVEGRNFMVTQLVSEIASAYYELLALDNQLLIVQENLDIQQNALEMIKLQKEAARATQLAVRRFEGEVFKNQSNKFEIQQQIVETENLINFLVGRFPQPVARSSQDFISIPLDTLSSGVPAQLLANRPDIRQAEFELSAAKLNVQVAKANFYPSIGLKAGVGLEAFKAKFIATTPESLAYSLVGDLVAPLINRNAIKATYSSANNQQLVAIYEYEQTILNAFIEVENQLSNVQNLDQSFKLKEQQVAALTESIDLSLQLFRAARAEYTEVLFTQREALDSKIEIVETKRDQLLANVRLYQALGGGWN